MSLDDQRRQFFIKYPSAGVIDEALRAPDNHTPSFYVSEIETTVDLGKTGFSLTRLGPRFERQYNIQGEIAIFYSPHRDLQRRGFKTISERLGETLRSEQERRSGGRARYSPSRKLALLVSADESIEDKIRRWEREDTPETQVVPIPVRHLESGDGFSVLVAALQAALGSRDLYQTPDAVQGDDFFGREEPLRQLTTLIDEGRNFVIQGLRRSGKTSLLYELRRRLLSRGVVLAVADFEMVIDSTVQLVPESIADAVVHRLREARDAGVRERVWLGPPQDQEHRGITFTQLSDRLKRLAAKNPTLRIVVAMDEVESAFRISKTDPEFVRALFGSLRSASQDQPNLTLGFCGVVNRMFRSSMIGPADRSVDNPLFGQVANVSLGPFSYAETSALVSGLGRDMLLDWKSEAVGLVHERSGGYPLFVRALASQTRSLALGGAESGPLSDNVPISAQHVDSAFAEWRAEANEQWMQVRASLNSHYAAAAELLNPELDDEDFDDWCHASEESLQAAVDLRDLGLLARREGHYVRGEALVALQALSTLRARQELASDRELATLLNGNESQHLEFKSSARVTVPGGKRERYIEDAVLKTIVGFLNADGGTLLIGVSDEAAVLGIEGDLAVTRHSIDDYERWLHGSLLDSRIELQLVMALISITFPVARGKQIARVDVRPSPKTIWVDDASVFVRNGNETRELTGRKAAEFAMERDRRDVGR